MDNEELTNIVQHENEELNLHIITRSGISHDLQDLRRVAVGRAKCVIWLEPDEDEVSLYRTFTLTLFRLLLLLNEQQLLQVSRA